VIPTECCVVGGMESWVNCSHLSSLLNWLSDIQCLQCLIGFALGGMRSRCLLFAVLLLFGAPGLSLSQVNPPGFCRVCVLQSLGQVDLDLDLLAVVSWYVPDSANQDLDRVVQKTPATAAHCRGWCSCYAGVAGRICLSHTGKLEAETKLS